MELSSTIKQVLSVSILPVIGIPIYTIGYTKINDTYGGTEDDWVVTLFSTMMLLVFGLAPLGLVYFIFKANR